MTHDMTPGGALHLLETSIRVIPHDVLSKALRSAPLIRPTH